MLTAEECRALLERDLLHYERFFSLDCNMNTLTIPACQLTIELNEAQKRLLVCLVEKVHCKRKIINIVWYENHQRIRDNNYHQLTFQLRSLFQRHGLPGQLVVTVPYYGLKFNEYLWGSLQQGQIPLTSPTTPQQKDRRWRYAAEIKRCCNWLLTSLTCFSLFIVM